MTPYTHVYAQYTQARKFTHKTYANTLEYAQTYARTQEYAQIYTQGQVHTILHFPSVLYAAV